MYSPYILYWSNKFTQKIFHLDNNKQNYTLQIFRGMQLILEKKLHQDMYIIHRGRGVYGNLDTEGEARGIQIHICTENPGL